MDADFSIRGIEVTTGRDPVQVHNTEAPCAGEDRKPANPGPACSGGREGDNGMRNSSMLVDIGVTKWELWVKRVVYQV